jgi:hypothetical protein
MNIHELWNKHFNAADRTWSSETAGELERVHAKLAAEGADIRAIVERHFGAPHMTWPESVQAAIAGFKADVAKAEGEAEAKPTVEVASKSEDE